MAWTKNRDRLHEAAISTVKAISKNKKLNSNTGIYQRPPSGNNIIFSSAPRSTKDLSKWRGEADFQAFWHKFHKKRKEIPLTLPARMLFNEFEISRVEILGSQEFIGSRKNISDFLNQRSNEFEDTKSLNYLSHGINLWLKEGVGFKFNAKSKTIINNLIEKYDIETVSEEFRNNIIENIHDQEKFEKAVIKLHKN